jgi:hypothetical protein
MCVCSFLLLLLKEREKGGKKRGAKGKGEKK